jgi:hypothetical protein
MWNKRFFQIIGFFCLSFGIVTPTRAEDVTAVLNVELSKQVAQMDEKIELQITLRNSSQTPFYVAGNIEPALLEPYGNYDLQVRRVGTNRYQTTTKLSSDPMPRAYGAPPSVSEFKAQKNIVLLQPLQFLGLRQSGTWSGLTAMPPGKYEVRVVYSASDRLPLSLDKPFLSGMIVSNVVEMEVVR